MFGKKDLSDAVAEAGTAIKMLEEASRQIKTLFYSQGTPSLKSAYIKDRVSKIQTFINLANNKLKSAASKMPKN